MDQGFAGTETTERLVIYAGRYFNRVRDKGLLEEGKLLSDWDVSSIRLHAAVREASSLVILDLFSFPFEAITGELESVPLVLVLPQGYDVTFLTTVFGAPAFERLGFFDRVATDDDALWEELRQKYGWATGQQVKIAASSPEEMLGTLLETEQPASPTPLVGLGNGVHSGSPRHWSPRGGRGGSSLDKAVHRAQAAVIEPQFVTAIGESVESAPFEVLELGAGSGRWAMSFDLTRTRYIGLDTSDDMVHAARANIPEAHFERLGNDLVVPYDDESFDLTFCVTFMQQNPTPAKRALLSEMWRVTRPAGRLMFLEDFVASKRPDGSGAHTMSVLAFVEVFLEATSGQIVLEHIESLRYPNEGFVRGGLLAVSKLGVPKSW